MARLLGLLRRKLRPRARLRALAPHVAGARYRLPHGTAGVALTFDDGPDPVHTPRILDELAARGAHATFFCVGAAVRAHPDLVRRMVADGHAVGSHSQDHHRSKTLPFLERVTQFRQGRHTLEAVVGRRIRLFRPPHGEIDWRTALAIRAAGVRPWLWNVDPGDWKPQAQRSEIARDVEHARAGDVLLLHDGLFDATAPSASDRSETVAAVGAILDRLEADQLPAVGLPER